MTPTSLVVSNDAYCSRVISSVFTSLGVRVTTAETFDTACVHLNAEHYDLVLVDCDDTYRGLEALKQAHLARANRSSILIALLNGATVAADAEDQGASIVISKPLLAEDLGKAVTPLVMRCRGYMRSHRRVEINIPAYVSFGTVFDRLVELTSISEGGIGFKSHEPVADGERLTVQFALPGLTEMRIRAELAWSDPTGAGGMKMIAIQPADLEVLRVWIASDRTFAAGQ